MSIARHRTTAPKSVRLDARLSPEQKQQFERAAALRHQTLTDFVLSSAQQAAEQTIREHSILTLSEQDSPAFAQAYFESITESNAPAPELVQLLRRHREALATD